MYQLNPTVFEIALERFARQVVKKARYNLTRKDNRASDELYKALSNWRVRVSRSSVELEFDLPEYYDYLDKGVKGKTGTKGNFQRRGPYSYKNKMPPLEPIEKWMKTKGIKANPYAIQNSIYHYGTPQTLFFTKAFESSFKTLPDSLVEAFELEVENFIEFVTKDY